LLGWPNIILAIFMAFILGAIVGLSLVIRGQKKLGQIVPFGPFLVSATVITLIWGDGLVNWYVSLL